MRQLMSPFVTAAFLSLPQAALAQSVITLDDFDLGGESEPLDEPNRIQGHKMEECLRDPSACEDEFGAGVDFTIDDVVNLGIIDREEVAETPASTDGTPSQSTQPLPSIDLEVLFDYNSSNIRGDQMGQLLELAQVLKGQEFSNFKLVFMGHTDAKGSAAYNEKLSKQRARSVADFVAAAANLPNSRVQAVGLGFQRLADTIDPFSERNRRVQLVLVPSG